MKPSKKLFHTGMSLSLAFLLVGGCGIAAANASDSLTSQMTLAEQAQVVSKWTGGVKYSVDSTDDAKLKAIGYDLNLAESESITNAYNDKNDDVKVLFKPKFDIATIKANAPEAKLIDFETPRFATDGTPYTVGASFNDDDFFWDGSNITTRELQDKPSLKAGQFSLNAIGDFGSADHLVDGADGAWESNIFAYPTSTTIDGGVPGDRPNTTGSEVTSGGSISIKTKYVDEYLPSDKRNADISLNGTQRSFDGAVTTDIVTHNGKLGVWLQPMITGQRTDGSGNHGSMALADPVFVTIDSTRQKAMPTYTSADNALTITTGEKVWMAPTKAKEGSSAGGRNGASEESRYGYNFYDVNVPLVATDAKELSDFYGDQFAGRFNQADIRGNIDGGFDFITSYDSTYYNATETLTADAIDTSVEQAVVVKEQAKVAPAQAIHDANVSKLDVAQKAYDKAVADGADSDAIFDAEWEVANAQAEFDASESDLNQTIIDLEDANQALADAKKKVSKNFTLTYSKIKMTGSDISNIWSQDGEALEAGTTWDSSDGGYSANFKVESNADGVLVIRVTLDNESTIAPRVISAGGATVGTGAKIGSSVVLYKAPGYEAKYANPTPETPETPEEPETPETPEEPEIPTPEEPEVPATPEETPEIPVPTPEEPTVVDDGTIDDIVLTDDGMVDDLAETGARDTGLMAWIASMMVGLGLGGIVLFGRKPHTAIK